MPLDAAPAGTRCVPSPGCRRSPLRKYCPLRRMSLTYSPYFSLPSAPKSPVSMISEKPMMALSGVRSSWLILARNSALARLALLGAFSLVEIMVDERRRARRIAARPRALERSRSVRGRKEALLLLEQLLLVAPGVHQHGLHSGADLPALILGEAGQRRCHRKAPASSRMNHAADRGDASELMRMLAPKAERARSRRDDGELAERSARSRMATMESTPSGVTNRAAPERFASATCSRPTRSPIDLISRWKPRLAMTCPSGR